MAEMNADCRRVRPESRGTFTMIMELVLRDMVQNRIARNLAWSLDDLVPLAICYANDVVLVAVSPEAAEVMVKETIEKLKEVAV